MKKSWIALALMLVTTALSASELAGLWKAKKRFGPDARGMLVLQRSGTSYTADLAGQIVPVTSANGEMTITLPNREGVIRGRLDAKSVWRGHWLRAPTPVSISRNGAPVTAAPVVLRADGANRWRGNIDPLEDSFTLYLLLEPRPDGSFRALLRNPDRDIGTQLGVEKLIRDGNKLRLMGKRRGQEQEVAAGTYDADGDVITLPFPSRGGTYDFLREHDDSAFYPRGKKPGRYSYQMPLALDDGWPVASLDAVDIDRAAIERLVQRIVDMPMDSPDAPQFHGLLIARHGKLVLEEYFHEQTRHTIHQTRSAGKSLTSLVVGAAMHAGVQLKLSSPVYKVMNGGEFPSGLEPQKRAMTLEDLLTMSGGFFCDDTNDDAPGNEEVMGEQTAEPDYYRYTMNVPMATPPGENSVYCSAMPNLALGMVGRAANEDPMVLFDRLMGEPMKIRRYSWGLDPLSRPYGGGGPNLILRDFIKLGQLMLNGGTWEGKRIVGKDFIERSGSPLYNLRKIYYGYYWWREDLPYKNRMVPAIQARGAGGQTVTVVPDLDLVVGTFAGSFFSRKGMFAASTNVTPQSIMPAVREPGDDKNAPVAVREWVDPYGASKDGSRVKP